MPSSLKPSEPRSDRENWDPAILAVWGLVVLSWLVPHRLPPEPIRGVAWVPFVGCLTLGLGFLVTAYLANRQFRRSMQFRVGQGIKPADEGSGWFLARAVAMALLGAPIFVLLAGVPLALFAFGADSVADTFGPAGVLVARCLTYVAAGLAVLGMGYWSAWRVGRWGALMGGAGAGTFVLLLVGQVLLVDHGSPVRLLTPDLFATLALGVAGGWLAIRRRRPAAPAS